VWEPKARGQATPSPMAVDRVIRVRPGIESIASEGKCFLIKPILVIGEGVSILNGVIFV